MADFLNSFLVNNVNLAPQPLHRGPTRPIGRPGRFLDGTSNTVFFGERPAPAFGALAGPALGPATFF